MALVTRLQNASKPGAVPASRRGFRDGMAEGLHTDATMLREHDSLIRTMARRMAWEHGADADDLVQAGRMALLAEGHKYDPERGTFEAFARWKVRCRMMDYLRDLRYRDIPAPLRSDSEPVSRDADPFEATARSQQIGRLMGGIHRLGRRKQLAIKLYFFDGVDQKEIAEILGIRQPMVSKLIKEALGELKAAMEAPACGYGNGRPWLVAVPGGKTE